MSSLPAGVSQHLVDTTLGAVFLGLVFSCILFGVSSLQVYLYYHHYPNDGLLHKGSIGVLWILDAFHIALTIFSSYHYGVASFGNLEKLEVVIWSFKLATAVQVVIILMVQSMYTYRLWLLSGYHHGVLRYLVTGIVLGGFGIGILLAYQTYTISKFSDLSTIAWAIEASFSASTTIDIGLSAAMCWYLRKSKSLALQSYQGGQLNSRISGLIQYTLSCGVFTSVCSLAALATFVAMPDNLIFLALTFILTRLYINSYTAMMNTRRRQSPTSGSRSGGGGGGGGLSFALSGGGGGGAARSGEAVVSIPLWETSRSRTPGDVESQQQQIRTQQQYPDVPQNSNSTAAEEKALEALDWGQGQGQREEDVRYPPYARDW